MRAVRDTIHEMAQRGIPAFVDRAGREWSPEAYVNMDVRNTVKNTATAAAFGTMDALGQDVFEVSSHAGARQKCRPWQGKLISKSGRTAEITDLRGRKYKVFPLSATSYGEPDGLFGINCGHRPRGVSDGLFVKSSKTSEEYGKDDEELYNRICRQRELERRVRKTKTEADMLEAAGDTEGAKAVRRRAAEQNKQLRAYCEENGLKYRGGRVKTYGKVTAGAGLTREAGDDIIKVDNLKDLFVAVPKGSDEISCFDGKILREIEEKMQLIPEKHRNVIDKTVKSVAIGKRRGEAHYNMQSKKLTLDPTTAKDNIIHECGHILADAYNIYSDPEFIGILKKGLDLSSGYVMEQRYSEEIDAWVFFVSSPKFVDPYQGRVYINPNTLDWGSAAKSYPIAGVYICWL